MVKHEPEVYFAKAKALLTPERVKKFSQTLAYIREAGRTKMPTRFFDHKTGQPISLNPDIGVTGYLPYFLEETDPDNAEKQLHKNYMHGGGFNHFDGFTMHPKTHVLTYPDDPPTKPIAKAMFRDELIIFYEHAWVAIVQKDGSFRIARMD